MQQLTQAFWAAILVTSLLSTAEAKRGCAAYGHSCFGGHGKRSGQSVAEMPDCKDDTFGTNPDCPPKIPIPMYEKYPSLNREVALGPNRYDIAQAIVEQRDVQYAVYHIIRQMVENARKAARDSNTNYPTIDNNQI